MSAADSPLDRVVARARRRMRLNRALAAGSRAAVAAAGAAAVWTVAGRLAPLPWGGLTVGVLLVAVTAAVAAAAAAVRIPDGWAARAADRWLGTQDAFATAVQLRGAEPTGLVALQRARAEETAAGVRGFPQGPRVPVRLLGVAAVVALAAAGLGVVPNPQDDVRARKAAEAAIASAEAGRLRDAASELRAADSAETRELADRLDALAEALEEEELTTALSELREERARLADDLDGDLPAQRTALSGLARELERDPLAAGDTPTEQLTELARALDEGADEQELRDLAERLEQLAAALPGAPGVADSLADAAGSAADGDAGAAAASLSEAAQAADAAQGRVAQQDAAARAEAALAEAERRLEGDQLADATGQGDGDGDGQGDGDGDGDGQGDGQGDGDGSGSGSGDGDGQGGGGGGGGGTPSGQVDDGGAREGQGTAGRGGDEGEQGDGGERPDDSRLDESVYDPPRRPDTDGDDLRLPGRPDDEGGEIDQGRGEGRGLESTPRVPYREVLGTYREAAIRAIERDGYPTRLRATVRDYFDALGASGGGAP